MEKRERLDALGFVWDKLKQKWEDNFSALKIFKEREGHCRVPYEHTENGYPIGQWIVSLRSRISELSDDRCRSLDEMGFVWDARNYRWEEGFRFLQAFSGREGHCRVPTNYIEDEYPLGEWVSSQRDNKSELMKVRRERLETS